MNKDLQKSDLRKAYELLSMKICTFEFWMSDFCFSILENDLTIEKVRVYEGEVLDATFTLRNKQVPFQVVR